MAQMTSIREVLAVTQSQSGDYAGQIRTGYPALDERWPDGTDASESDKFWDDISATIADGATTTLNLKSLANGPGGTTVDFAEVRAIWFKSDRELTLAKGAVTGWTGLGAAWTITLPAGVWFKLVCPTDGALGTVALNKQIDISNASGALATYSILIVGTSA